MRVKNRIKRAAPVLGGQFTTHTFIHGDNGWLDANFLGTRPPISYSLALQTTRYEYQELVRDRAWEQSCERAPERDLPLLDRAVKDPQTGHYVSRRREPRRYPELENLTRLQWCEAQHRRIADSGEIAVFEQWTLHHDYHHSVGLHATLNAPVLTVDAVKVFIERFLLTEANFLDPTPHSYHFDEVAHWGLDANALAEPWEWAAALKREAPDGATAVHVLAAGVQAVSEEGSDDDSSGA